MRCKRRWLPVARTWMCLVAIFQIFFLAYEFGYLIALAFNFFIHFQNFWRGIWSLLYIVVLLLAILQHMYNNHAANHERYQGDQKKKINWLCRSFLTHNYGTRSFKSAILRVASEKFVAKVAMKLQVWKIMNNLGACNAFAKQTSFVTFTPSARFDLNFLLKIFLKTSERTQIWIICVCSFLEKAWFRFSLFVPVMNLLRL